MAKYHINYKGEAGLCRAEKNCPFGGDEDHFVSPEAARAAYESIHDEAKHASLQGLTKKSPPAQDEGRPNVLLASGEDSGISEEQIVQMRKAAYAGVENGWRPYSKFPAAAATMAKSGKVYGGAGNVESSNFSLTKHAEETAMIAAIADGAIRNDGRTFLKAIYIPMIGGHRAMSCGGCRQFLWEFSDNQTMMINETPEGFEIRPLTELLPEPFGPDDLGITEADNPLSSQDLSRLKK